MVRAMDKESKIARMDTTRVETQEASTITGVGSDGAPADPVAGSQPAAGKGLGPLIANYQAIKQARAIYYPVAYRFVRELGQGRQGVVYQGLRQGARGCVTRHAIKVFDPGIYPTAKKYWTDMGRIADQTSKLQTIKSPNLVSPDIYEEYNGIGYVQMESVNGVGIRYLLDGEHLHRVRTNSTDEEWNRFMDVIFRQDGGKLSIQPGVVIYMMRRVLRGLEILHDKGFVHCDVKPANIMIDSLGYVKVIDYGRATKIDERVTFLLGTPVYMAPEMHRRENALIQSDIYTAGMVMLELLLGDVPIKVRGVTEQDLLSQKMSLADRLHEILPYHILQNEAFVMTLRRFLDPDPAKRFEDAQEAESGKEGLILVHKQLALVGKDTEYGRELENYLAKLENPESGEVVI